MEMITVECPKCKGSLQVDSKHEKIFCMYCRAEVTVKKQKASASATAKTLIRKGFLSIEHKEWGKAKTALNKAAEIEPENAQIYLGLLMVETRVQKEEELGFVHRYFPKTALHESAYSIASLSQLTSFKKAEQFADDELKNRLKSYNEQVTAIIQEIRARRNWKWWTKTLVHSFLYPYLILELVYWFTDGELFLLTQIALDPNRRFVSDALFFNWIFFPLVWILALLVVGTVSSSKIKSKVVEAFRVRSLK